MIVPVLYWIAFTEEIDLLNLDSQNYFLNMSNHHVTPPLPTGALAPLDFLGKSRGALAGAPRDILGMFTGAPLDFQ